MVGAKLLSSDVSARHGLFGLACTIWFLSALSVAGSVDIRTIPKIRASCGQNLTLTCNVNSTQPLDIKEFFWMEKEKQICQWGGPSNQTNMVCRNTSAGGVYNFTLTILNVMPLHKGTYHCKLRAKEGVKNDQTIVRVQKCLGESDSAASHTEATCTFKDVFPSAKVKWFQGTSPVDASVFNVTTTEKEDSLGRFTITSRVKWNPSKREPYNCSLWMDIENPDNTTTAQMVRSFMVSGRGCMFNVHWLCVVMMMMLGLLMA